MLIIPSLRLLSFPFLELYYWFVRTAGMLTTLAFVIFQIFGFLGSAHQEISSVSSSNTSIEFYYILLFFFLFNFQGLFLVFRMFFFP